MKIFITGATGFIGKHLVNYLKVDNQITINLYGDEKSPFEKGVNTYKLREDESSKDIEFLQNEKFDGIIHLASLYLTTHTPEQATKLIDSNVRFSTYILECAAQAKINWFINTGTFWQHYENKLYSPVNLYAASKQAFESIAQYYWETNQIKFCTLKLSDTYGPNDTRPKIFNLWMKIAKTGEALDMSQGEQLIDISNVDDIVQAYSLLAKQLYNNDPKFKNGDTFAVRADKRYTLRELAEIFERATNEKLNINWGAKRYREREVMQPPTRIEGLPGWMPKYSVITGLEEFLKSNKL